jgi:hypothetical protein
LGIHPSKPNARLSDFVDCNIKQFRYLIKPTNVTVVLGYFKNFNKVLGIALWVNRLTLALNRQTLRKTKIPYAVVLFRANYEFSAVSNLVSEKLL